MASSFRSLSLTSDCAASTAEKLLETLLAEERVVGCFIADSEGGVGLQRLPGLLRQTPLFRRAKQILKKYSEARVSLEGATVRVADSCGLIFFRRIETLYLCALALPDGDSTAVVTALRSAAKSMPGGLKMASSIPPPPSPRSGPKAELGFVV